MAIRTVAALLFVLGSALTGSAQDRMPPIPPEKMTDAQKKAVDEFKAARNAELSGPFVPLLRSPEVLSRARAMGDYLRFKSVLPPRLSEFAILIAARQWTQQYEWDAHHALAMQAGLRPEIAAAVAEGRRPEKMAEDEDILYTFLMELHRNQSVSDASYQRMVARFGEQGVVDAIGIQGYYTLLAMVMNTARTPLGRGRVPALKPLR
jgi:4-carboxymuconolactone decarboxylase